MLTTRPAVRLEGERAQWVLATGLAAVLRRGSADQAWGRAPVLGRRSGQGGGTGCEHTPKEETGAVRRGQRQAGGPRRRGAAESSEGERRERRRPQGRAVYPLHGAGA